MQYRPGTFSRECPSYCLLASVARGQQPPPPSGNGAVAQFHILNPVTECRKGQQILILHLCLHGGTQVFVSDMAASVGKG